MTTAAYQIEGGALLGGGTPSSRDNLLGDPGGIVSLYHWDPPLELMEHRGWLIRDTAERLADPLRAGLVYLGRSRPCVDDAGRTVVAHRLRARRADRLAGNASRCGGRCRRWWRCSRVLFSAFLDGWEWAEGFTRQFGQCGWIGRAAIGIRGRPSTSTGASSEGITKARRHEARRRPGLIVGNASCFEQARRADIHAPMRRADPADRDADECAVRRRSGVH